MASPEPRHSDLHTSLTHATERIQEIVTAAEKVAEEMQREAEEEAAQYLQARRREADQLASDRAIELEAVLKRLREQLHRFEQETASMVGVLEEAIESARRSRSVGDSPPAGPVAVSSDSPPAFRTWAKPDPPPARTRDSIGLAPSADPGSVPAGRPAADASPFSADAQAALIRAAQLAVQGRSRPEIEATLREQFALDDPGAVVDTILGPS